MDSIHGVCLIDRLPELGLQVEAASVQEVAEVAGQDGGEGVALVPVLAYAPPPVPSRPPPIITWTASTACAFFTNFS